MGFRLRRSYSNGHNGLTSVSTGFNLNVPGDTKPASQPFFWNPLSGHPQQADPVKNRIKATQSRATRSSDRKNKSRGGR